MLLGLLGVACVPAVAQYQPPAMSEPHAEVKFQFTYDVWLGPTLTQTVMHNNVPVRGIPVPVPVGQKGAASHTVIVRPEATVWTLRGEFFHEEVNTKTVTIYTPVSRQCGESFCSESIATTRVVNEKNHVVDGACSVKFSQLPQAGGNYLISYAFLPGARCTVTCVRQSRSPDGSITDRPCEPASPSVRTP